MLTAKNIIAMKQNFFLPVTVFSGKKTFSGIGNFEAPFRDDGHCTLFYLKVAVT